VGSPILLDQTSSLLDRPLLRTAALADTSPTPPQSAEDALMRRRCHPESFDGERQGFGSV